MKPNRAPTIVVALLLTLIVTASPLSIARHSARAATVTTAWDAELRAEPSWTSPVLMLVAAGEAVSLDGPPQTGFYPVTYAGTSGWLPAEPLVIEKDATLADETNAGTSDPSEDVVDLGVPASEAEDGVPPTLDAESTTGSIDAAPLAMTPAPPVEATSAPDLSGAPMPTPGATAPFSVAEPTPFEEAAAATEGPIAPPSTTAVPTETPITMPTVLAPETESATPEPTAALAPTATAVAPAPTSTPTIPTSGPATATTNLPLRAGPDDAYDSLFSVSAGATVYRTGSVVNRWVSVDYMGIVGWIEARLLAEPLPIAAESTATPLPEPTDEQTGVGGPFDLGGEAEPTRVARPGTGAAFAENDLSLRSGPSSTYPEMGTISSGTRVVLTGVMENGYVRIEHRGAVGWVAFDALSHPADPTPATSPRGSDSRRVYSRQEIIKVIYAAADRYGQPRADMLRVAECESNLGPYAVNPSGSYGLFQFISSTWDSTPYANRNIFDPQANANAAAWMWAEGRRSEWVCQ